MGWSRIVTLGLGMAPAVERERGSEEVDAWRVGVVVEVGSLRMGKASLGEGGTLGMESWRSSGVGEEMEGGEDIASGCGLSYNTVRSEAGL